MASTLTRVSEAAKDRKARKWAYTVTTVKSFKVAVPIVFTVIVAPLIVVAILVTKDVREPISQRERNKIDAFIVPAWNKPGCNGAVVRRRPLTPLSSSSLPTPVTFFFLPPILRSPLFFLVHFLFSIMPF